MRVWLIERFYDNPLSKSIHGFHTNGKDTLQLNSEMFMLMSSLHLIRYIRYTGPYEILSFLSIRNIEDRRKIGARVVYFPKVFFLKVIFYKENSLDFLCIQIKMTTYTNSSINRLTQFDKFRIRNERAL